MDIATGMAAGGSAAVVVLARDLIGVLRAWAANRSNGNNGNGKRPAHHDSTDGKRICDYHMELERTVSRVDQKQDDMKEQIRIIAIDITEIREAVRK